MTLAAAAMLASFFVWGALGMPIGFAMLSSAFLYLMLRGQDIALVASQSLNGLFRSFVLLAVPLFIVAAEIMNAGTISERLLKFASLIVGRIRGGLAHVTVVASMIFSGMSGSAIADAARPGQADDRDDAEREGATNRDFAGALAAAAATIGPIIPPSIPMVLYAMVANTSVGYLFLGGFMPGVLMGISLMAVIMIVARRENLPVEAPVRLAEVPGDFARFHTGPDASGDSAGWHLQWRRYADGSRRCRCGLRAAARLLPVSRRRVRPADGTVRRGLAFDGDCGPGRGRRPAGQLCGGGRTDSQPDRCLDPVAPCVALRLPADHQSAVPGLGCFLDTLLMLLVIVPIALPTITALGIDKVHFGVTTTVNLMIGMITPPYSELLFVVTGITGISLSAMYRYIWPFILALIASLLIMLALPEVVLWLPMQLGYTPGE